jgi:tetratricopeptide (TPR) repeat protein
MIRLGAIAGFVLATAVAGGPAFAQPSQEEFDALFQQVLARPMDRDINNRYIQAAIELKDYEAAIGSVDRLLFHHPEDAEMQFLAGDLYFRLKSYLVSKSYFEQVIKLDTASPELKAEAERMIVEIEEALIPSPWRFFAQAGVRYQTNANAGPSGLNLDPSGLAQEDWNSFALFSLGHTLPLSERVTWESTLRGYVADQDKIERLDLLMFEVSSGPRFFLNDEKDFSVRPYALASHIWLGDDDYQTVGAGGLSIRKVVGKTSIEPYIEARERGYYDSDDYPAATERDGQFLTAAARAWGEFNEHVRWNSRVGYNYNDADVAYESYQQPFVDFTLPISFSSDAERPIVLTPFFAMELTQYEDSEDPLDMDRRDFEYRAGARLEVPFGEMAGLSFQIQYTDNESNVDAYSYDNISVTLGPTVRF